MVDNRWTAINQLITNSLSFAEWRDEAIAVWLDVSLSERCAWSPSEDWQDLAVGSERYGALLSPEIREAETVLVPIGDDQWAWSLDEAGWLVVSGMAAEPDAILMMLWRLLASQWQLRGRLELAQRQAYIESWLLSSVSHDLRAPLNSILGFLELVDKPGFNVIRQLPVVKNEAERLQGLINQLLDFSRLQAKRMTLVPTATNLLEWVGQAIAPWRGPAADKQLELAVDLVKPLPAAVLVDAERLLQVVHNLISNAIKFTSNGRVQLTVCADVVARRLELLVTDTGLGIEASRQEQLFDPFVQARNEDQFNQDGMGLGLSIVKQLTDLMGGVVDLVSEPDKGATFRLTIPYEDTADPLHSDYRNCFEGGRVMVIDDVADRANTVCHYLEYFGVQPYCVTSGPEALFQLRQSSSMPDWLFIHSTLKGLDAQTTLEGIAEQADLSAAELAERVVWLINAPHDERKEYRSLLTPLTLINLYQTMMFRHRTDVRLEDKAAPTVLVVDDTELNLQLSEIQLNSLGISVLKARSGDEALALLEKHAIDLVFMDIMMPRMDGYEATRRIRSLEYPEGVASVPIIALTASSQFRDPATYRAVGMNGYLAKPYRPEQLYAIIRRYLPDFSSSITHDKALTMHLSDDTQPTLVDWDRALTMVGGEESVLVSILEPFMAGLNETVSDLMSAREQRDWDTFQRRAHSLKAMLRTFGAQPLGDAVFALEQAAKSRQALEVAQAWHGFEALYPDTRALLMAHLEGYA